MSSLNVTNLKHASSTNNNIVLASDGSTTFHNLTADGVWVDNGSISTSGQSIQFNNIDADTHTLVLDLAGVTQGGTSDGTPQLGLRFGTSSTIDTGNNYSWRLYDSSNTQEGNIPDSYVRLTTSVRSWQGHTWYGHVRISQVNGNSHWIVSWQIKSTDCSISGAGVWTNTGNLSSIQLFKPTSSGTWSGGSVHLRSFQH